MSTCLILGASGYIGVHLTAALTATGHRVRGFARSLTDAPDAIQGDVLDPLALSAAMREVDVVYHLVHSMSGDDFVAHDEKIARAVASAAAEAGVRQLVYLGGPRPTDGEVSAHLASRAQVGDIFLAAPTPALVLQASMIIGAGSASFELLAKAARGGPVLPNPSYMSNRSRPIAIRDVLHYLVEAADGAPVNEIADIAGPDTVTYLDLVQRCARVAGLPRRIALPVVLPPAVAAAITSEPLVRALLESLRHDLVPAEVMPPPPGGGTSLDRALRDALGVPAPEGPPVDSPGMLRDRKTTRVRATRDQLWDVITDIGGTNGWHTIPGAWSLRGAVDHLIGGVGLHRGRPEHLAAGDTVDSWSVVARSDDTTELLLRTDMRLPGRAWLSLRATPGPTPTESVLEQTTWFHPHGLAGKLYWYTQKPAHDIIFATMATGIAKTAESRDA
ncbi:SDR family oxidoreductase [Actinokineospora globicatena]|uniref:SDR family oxidoreductase n=1 Tax=Actinokineospora globicatena TaxID=103729 RepID=UPI0020A3DB03|nr:SDR family oxidoreductase [Actinokineospora globicatena]MCP2306879.1 Uncharacterized conserved protein YbjT, contains NAD(P)-binding and DUF2867 domains [Actinokineospora globicatena]GLW82321.1 NAD-dependent dehydratase [Actinokineospora globicatena]GLW89086.1 NAD-dependent dehydratase [Actinokineospora globicatena]